MKKLETTMKIIAIVLICILCILVNTVEKTTTNETCYHCVENLKIKATMSSEHYPMKMYNPVSGLGNTIGTYINYKCKSKDCRCSDRCHNIYKTTK